MKISIVTINYNNVNGLQQTVQSVFDQTWHDIEYIIIDGGSTDGSVDIIKNNKEKFYYWVSEGDKGPYDAMNKGINQVTGDYVLFLNSGDYLFDSNVIKNFIHLNPTDDLVYGDCAIISENGKQSRKVMTSIYTIGEALTNTINHQSIFYSGRLFKGGKRYDINYKIVADWILTNEFVFELNCTLCKINLIIAVYDLNGISSNNEERKKERKKYTDLKYDDKFNLLLTDYKSLKLKYNIIKKGFIYRNIEKFLNLFSLNNKV